MVELVFCFYNITSNQSTNTDTTWSEEKDTKAPSEKVNRTRIFRAHDSTLR